MRMILLIQSAAQRQAVSGARPLNFAGAPQHVNDVLTVPAQGASAREVLSTEIAGRGAQRAARADRVAHERINRHLGWIGSRRHADQAWQIAENAAGRFAGADVGWR